MFLNLAFIVNLQSMKAVCQLIRLQEHNGVEARVPLMNTDERNCSFCEKHLAVNPGLNYQVKQWNPLWVWPSDQLVITNLTQ